MVRASGVVSLSVILAASVACSGWNKPSSDPISPSTSVSAHAENGDPRHDAATDSKVSIPPDLIWMTADVSAKNSTWIVQFEPGTLDRQTTRVSIFLDTDQNAATGATQWKAFGADYRIDFDPPSGQATVLRADPSGCAAPVSCFVAVGSAPLAFFEQTLRTTIPLTLLGADDGLMNFWLNAYAMVASMPSAALDSMPDRPEETGPLRLK